MSKYTAKHSAARHVVMQPLHLQHPLHEYIRPRVLQPPDGECKGLKKDGPSFPLNRKDGPLNTYYIRLNRMLNG